MPQPDANLGVGSGTHAEQTAAAMVGVERDLVDAPRRPACWSRATSTRRWRRRSPRPSCSVAGRPRRVRACARATGRCRRRSTGSSPTASPTCCSAPPTDAVENLAGEGITGDGVELVGNTMIDSLLRILDGTDRDGRAASRRSSGAASCSSPCTGRRWWTTRERLGAVIAVLGEIVADGFPVLFPAHPRTDREAGGGRDRAARRGSGCVEPLDYAEFIALEAEARLVITDSGGVQEETTVLGVPCLTYRDHHRAPDHRDPGHEQAGRDGPRRPARGSRGRTRRAAARGGAARSHSGTGQLARAPPRRSAPPWPGTEPRPQRPLTAPPRNRAPRRHNAAGVGPGGVNAPAWRQRAGRW